MAAVSPSVFIYHIFMDNDVVVMNSLTALQAAWIIDDTDEEDSDAKDDDDDDEGDDGMVLDEGESGFPSQKGTNNPDFEEDQASLYLRDSDEETENDSVMMVCLFDVQFCCNFYIINYKELPAICSCVSL